MLAAALFTPAGLAGLALGLLSSRPAPAVAAEINTPVVSGLPWRSGASVDSPFVDFAGWRGRRLDANVMFVATHDSWADMTQWFNGLKSKAAIKRSPLPVISLPMLPHEAAKQFAACASGDFDGYYRQYGQLIASAGAGGAVVRLGWEANKTRPWSPNTAADIPDYVACFRREAAALKSTAPDLKIEWTMGRISNVPFNVMDMYPGDQHVDLIGVHYYDNVGPKIATQAAWDYHYTRTYNGGPRGLGTWLEVAKERGKRLAVSEWGVWDQGDLSKADNPVYVENMHRFFRANAADLAYENYYNRPLVHQLHPSTKFARARARYRDLWSVGR